MRDTDQQPKQVVNGRSHDERRPADTGQATEAEWEIEHGTSDETSDQAQDRTP